MTSASELHAFTQGPPPSIGDKWVHIFSSPTSQSVTWFRRKPTDLPPLTLKVIRISSCRTFPPPRQDQRVFLNAVFLRMTCHQDHLNYLFKQFLGGRICYQGPDLLQVRVANLCCFSVELDLIGKTTGLIYGMTGSSPTSDKSLHATSVHLTFTNPNLSAAHQFLEGIKSLRDAFG